MLLGNIKLARYNILSLKVYKEYKENISVSNIMKRNGISRTTIYKMIKVQQRATTISKVIR